MRVTEDFDYADYNDHFDFDADGEDDETWELLPCVASPPPNCPTSQDTKIYFRKYQIQIPFRCRTKT